VVRVETKASDWQVPSVLPAVLFAVAFPVVVFELNDALLLWITYWEDNQKRGLGLNALNWSSVPACLIFAHTLSRRGLQGVYLAIFGLLLALFVVQNCRSYVIRFGTFDLWQDNRWIWLTPVTVGTITGLLTGFLWPWPQRSFAQPLVVVLWTSTLAITSLGVTFAICVVHSSDWSAFVPARHIIELMIAAVAIGLAFFFFFLRSRS